MRVALNQPSTPRPFCSSGHSQATNPSSLLPPYSGSLHIRAAPTPSLIYTLTPHGRRQLPAISLLAQGKQNPRRGPPGLKFPHPAHPTLHCLQRLETVSVYRVTHAEHQGAPSNRPSCYLWTPPSPFQAWREMGACRGLLHGKLRPRPLLGPLWSPKPGPSPSG